MTPREALLFVAGTQVGVSECPPNSNSGPKVEAYQAATGGKKGDPWCADFLAWCALAAAPFGVMWPLPLTGSCQALYLAAKAKGLLTKTPKAGDLFLLWFPTLGRYAHVGLIEKVSPDKSLVTLEGNTNPGGGREGWIVARRTRTLGKQDALIGGWT